MRVQVARSALNARGDHASWKSEKQMIGRCDGDYDYDSLLRTVDFPREISDIKRSGGVIRGEIDLPDSLCPVSR
jgi:hypothetical protein